MEQICRVCLAKSVPMIDLFKGNASRKDGLRPVDIINKCVDSTLIRGDALTRKICLLCLRQACFIVGFKIAFAASQKRLISQVINDEINKKVADSRAQEQEQEHKHEHDEEHKHEQEQEQNQEEVEETTIVKIRTLKRRRSRLNIPKRKCQKRVINQDVIGPRIPRPYKCKECSRAYHTLQRLRVHIANMH